MLGRNVDLDLVREAMNISEEGKKRGIIIRIMGATAFRIHCPNFLWFHKKFNRELSDLDFISYSKHSSEIMKLFNEFGYISEEALSTYLTKRRIFHSKDGAYVVDVFFDELNMCHRIDFKGRLEVDYPTIPLADLLLEKLQIVEFTNKDAIDVVMLLREHDIADHDKEVINQERIADLLSKDWGFYYTATTNLKKLRGFLKHTDVANTLSNTDVIDVDKKIDQLLKVIETKPKTMKWKMRAKIGTKKRWYQEVESKR